MKVNKKSLIFLGLIAFITWSLLIYIICTQKSSIIQIGLTIYVILIFLDVGCVIWSCFNKHLDIQRAIIPDTLSLINFLLKSFIFTPIIQYLLKSSNKSIEKVGTPTIIWIFIIGAILLWAITIFSKVASLNIKNHINQKEQQLHTNKLNITHKKHL